MQFMVQGHFKVFNEDVQALMPAERQMVNQLVADGFIQAFYLAADFSAGWTVVECASEEVLWATYKKIPTFEYMEFKVTSLADQKPAEDEATW